MAVIQDGGGGLDFYVPPPDQPGQSGSDLPSGYRPPVQPAIGPDLPSGYRPPKEPREPRDDTGIVPPQGGAVPPPAGAGAGNWADALGAIADAFKQAIGAFPPGFNFGGGAPQPNEPNLPSGYRPTPVSPTPTGEYVPGDIKGIGGRSRMPLGAPPQPTDTSGFPPGFFPPGYSPTYRRPGETPVPVEIPSAPGLPRRPGTGAGIPVGIGPGRAHRNLYPPGGAGPIPPPVGGPASGPTGPAAPGTQIPKGTTFGFDTNTRTYYFSDGKGGSIPLSEGELQRNLQAAATKSGLSGQEVWDFIVNQATAKGGQIFFKSLSGANLDAVAAAAAQAKKQSPDAVKPGGGGGAGGEGAGGKFKLAPDADLPGVGKPAAKEYGGANNRYFQEIAHAEGRNEISDSDAWRAAVAGGFTGDYNSWLVTKDQIIHQSRQGGGGRATPSEVTPPGGGTTPPAVTPPPTATPPGEPNIRPFPNLSGTIQFDENDIGSLPQVYQPLVQQLMQALGYTSTGFLGKFGEREYNIAGQPKKLTEDILNTITTDPTAQAWLQWLAYRKGMLGVIEPYPTKGF